MTVVRDALGGREATQMPPVEAPELHDGARYRRLVRLGLRRRD
jgi:hypothetical protein